MRRELDCDRQQVMWLYLLTPKREIISVNKMARWLGWMPDLGVQAMGLETCVAEYTEVVKKSEGTVSKLRTKEAEQFVNGRKFWHMDWVRDMIKKVNPNGRLF